MLKKWREEQQASAQDLDMPVALLKTVKALHVELQQLADKRVDKLSQEHQATYSKLSEQRQADQKTIQALTENLELSTNKAAQFETKSRELQAELTSTLKAQDDLQAKQDQSNLRNQNLDEKNRALKEEMNSLREHFDHYQKHALEQRLYERDQHQQALQMTSHQLQDSDARNKQLQELLEQTQAEQQTNKLTVEDLNKNISEHVNHTKALEQKLSHIESSKDQLQKSHQEISQKFKDQQDQMDETNKTNMLLEAELKSKTHEATQLSQSLNSLTEELQVTRDQKHILQGKLSAISKLYDNKEAEPET